MNFFDSVSDKTLNLAIIIVAILLVIVIIAGLGVYVYRQESGQNYSPAVQKQINDAEAAISKNPKDADARVRLATIYLSEDQYDDAKTELEEALKANKNHIGANQLMGAVYENEGNISQAVSYYKKTISLSEKTEFQSLNPYLYEAIYRLGAIYNDQKKYKDAVIVLKKGVTINPIDSDLRYQLGIAYVRDKKPDEAVTQFKEAVKYVPDFAEAYYWLGRAYELKGDKDLAKNAYRDALKYKPDYPEAKEAISRLS